MIESDTIKLLRECDAGVILISRKSATVKSPQNRCTMGFAAILQTLFNGK